MPIVTIVHCSNNENFYGLIPPPRPPPKKKKTVARERDVFDFGQSLSLPLFDSYAVVLS